MKGKTTSEQECLVKTRDDLAVNEFDEDAGNYSDKQLASALPKHQETSILLAIHAAVPQEDHLHGFISHVLTLFRNSSNAVVCKTLLTVVAIFIFIVGVIRFRECPYEQELPLFLVLEGVVIILKTGLHALNTCQRRLKDENERNTIDTCSDILSLFLVLWTLTGTVWTFGVYSHVNMDEDSRDCSKLVYMCSMWFLIAIYCCFVTFLLMLSMLCLYYKCNKSNSNKSELPYEVQVER